MDTQLLIELIKRAMGEYSINTFAEKAGINAGNLSRVLRGQNVSAELLLKIADASQDRVSSQELLFAAGYTGAKIPIYGTVAAGSPINAYEEMDGFVEISDIDTSRADYFALRIRGNSMDAAHIPDKSVVVVQKQSTLQNGEIGVFEIEGEATVKQLARAGSNIVLMPVSTDESHKPQVYDNSYNVHVLGKVVKAIIDV